MIPLVLKFATSRLTGPIATVLLILALTFAVGQCSDKQKAQRQLAKAEKARAVAVRDLGTCRTNVETLKGSLDRQNAAVNALKAESDARQRASAKAVKDARAVAESHRRSATAILAAKPEGDDLCKAADLLIIGSLR